MPGSYTIQIGPDTLVIDYIGDMEKFRALVAANPPKTFEEWKNAAKKANNGSLSN